MGVTLDEAQIHQLYKLKDEGKTNKQIAKAIGASESCVKSYIRARKERAVGAEMPSKKDLSADSRTHARIEETRSETGQKQVRKNDLRSDLIDAYAEAAEIDRMELATASLRDLDDIMERCKKGLRRTDGIEDGKDRAIAEASYLKIMRDIAIARGRYGGLDDVPTDTPVVSPLESMSDTLARYREEEES